MTRDQRRAVALVVGCIAVAGILFVVAKASGVGDISTTTTTTSISTTTTDDSTAVYGALDVCRQEVRTQLLAPSTAKISPLSPASAVARDGGAFHVTGTVDSQNAFGVTLRSDWVCDAVPAGDGQWTATATVTPR